MRAVLLFALPLLVCSPALAQDRIHVDCEQLDLAQAMDQVGRLSGQNILVDPAVRETITISLRGVPWREAVDVMAAMTRCEIEELPGGILYLTQPPKVTLRFTDANARTVLQLVDADAPNAAIVNDRIYHEGDTIIDEATDEPVDGLRVTRVERSVVRFTFGDLEFVRELKPAD
jgi:type II secretory pathway component GspD/PulD (secretin)